MQPMTYQEERRRSP
jgi:hypothetical protein